MWTLFKREIQDTWAFLLVFPLTTIGSILAIEFKEKTPNPLDGVFGYGILCVLLLIVACTRMTADRTHGISFFFAGHLTIRGQVFAVRLLMGLIHILLFCAPLLGWFFWRLWSTEKHLPEFLSPIPLQTAFFLLIFPFTFYILGLKMELSHSKAIPLLASLCFGVLIFTSVLIKGTGVEAIILIILLNLALIYSSWRNYAAAAL
jgi:hypothetical protein